MLGGKLTLRSHLDEAAAKQRQREAEAEAKIQAKKTGGLAARLSERPNPQRSESSDLAPPKIAGAGGGWRERQAAKEAGQSAAPASTVAAAAASPAPQRDSETPTTKTGGKFVLPHLRGKGADGAPPRGESPADGWRGAPRVKVENTESTTSSPQRTTDNQEGSNRDRTQSPANGAAPKTFERSFSGRGDVPDRTESPAAPQKPKVGVPYIPIHLRSK